MHGAAPTSDYYPGSQYNDWKLPLTMHLQEHAFGGSLCAGIKVASLDLRVERCLLGNRARSSSRVVGIDSAGVYEALDAGGQGCFRDLLRSTYLVAFVVGPALHIGSGQMINAVDSLQRAPQSSGIVRISSHTLEPGIAQIRHDLAGTSNQYAHAMAGFNHPSHQFTANESGGSEYENLRGR